MLKSSKCFSNGLPLRGESTLQNSSYKLQTPIPRATPGHHSESPAPMNRENNYPETGSRRAIQTISPARTSLQDIPINQYDSVMVNSRCEEIKRKYGSHIKPSTPLRELTNNTATKEVHQRSPAAEVRVHSFTKNTWQSKEVTRTTTEGIMGSASKQKEMDILAEQVKQIRRSFRVQEIQRTRSLSRNTSSFISQVPNFGRSHERGLEDPRVQSIDKINLKIKQILNCLSENQKHITDGSSITPQVTSSQYQPVELISRDKDAIKERQIRDTRVSTTESKVTKPDLRISESFISNGQGPIRQSFIKSEQKEQSRRYSLYTHKAGERLERAQSSLPMRNSILLSKRPDSSMNRKDGECILSSGKDLDEEIRKIQQKIRRSQQQKRRLDIKFQSSKLSDFGVPQRRIAPVTINPPENRRSDKALQSIEIPRLGTYQRSSAKKSNMDESPSFKQLPQAKEDIRAREGLRSAASKQALITSSSTSAFMVPTMSSSTRTGVSTVSVTTSSNTSASVMRQERTYGYKRPSSQVYKTFKAAPKPQPTSVSEVETKKLVERLKQQVAYDEQLRNSKLNFAALVDPNRWSKLKEELQKRGVTLNEAELKVQFDLSLEEHNPFYSVRETQQPPESVAQKYIASLEYWNRYLLRNFDSKALANESFKQDRIDLERKGFLTVEDFVRFLNIETGTFYRNRDLILIFRRMTSEPKISFETFIKTVCQ